jgi:hypothetical protein
LLKLLETPVFVDSHNDSFVKAVIHLHHIYPFLFIGFVPIAEELLLFGEVVKRCPHPFELILGEEVGTQTVEELPPKQDGKTGSFEVLFEMGSNPLLHVGEFMRPDELEIVVELFKNGGVIVKLVGVDVDA